jgi:subtilisin family serine protease
LRFLDANNRGFLSDAVAALNYATLMKTRFAVNLRVTNNSWVSGTEPDTALREAIAATDAADILFVAAAGNGDIIGRGIDLDEDAHYPAAFDFDNILSVAATDNHDGLARFSNYGLQSVDVAAPGLAVWSTEPDGQYGSRNGTSMAAPHVTGVAALIWSRVPQAAAKEVREAILQGADVIPGLQSKIAGGRRLNAYGALLVDTAAPSPTLLSAPDVTGTEVAYVDVVVEYRDDQAVDSTTLGAADLVVTRLEDGVEITPSEVELLEVQDSGRIVTAQYRIPAPGEE